MSNRTGIEWTETTWNPTTGCDRVSPGCDNCYALSFARRLQAMGQPKYQNDGDPRTSGPGFGLTLHPDTLEAPYRWKAPELIFVNSMSDLFHPKVPLRLHPLGLPSHVRNISPHLPDAHQTFPPPSRPRSRTRMARQTSGWASASRAPATRSVSTTSAPSPPPSASSAPNPF